MLLQDCKRLPFPLQDLSRSMLPFPSIQGSAIKAAYFSAAFILRSIAADRLDIDPEEIDISNLRAVPGGSGFLGELVMSDHLANGAGFTRWVSENWQSLLADATNTNRRQDQSFTT